MDELKEIQELSRKISELKCLKLQAQIRSNSRIPDKIDDDIFYAWLAGLFDGEGTIQITKNTLYISIVLTDYDVLRYIKSKMSLGKPNNKSLHTPKRIREYKQSYNYQISSYNALTFLERIIKHLVIKKPQAQLAIEYIRQRNIYQGTKKGLPEEEHIKRKWFRDELKKLRKIEYI